MIPNGSKQANGTQRPIQANGTLWSKEGKWVPSGPKYTKGAQCQGFSTNMTSRSTPLVFKLDTQEERKDYKKPPDDDPAAPLSGTERGARPGWGGKCENTARCHTWV